MAKKKTVKKTSTKNNKKKATTKKKKTDVVQNDPVKDKKTIRGNIAYQTVGAKGEMMYVSPDVLVSWDKQPRKEVGDVETLLGQIKKVKRILQSLTVRRLENGDLQLLCGTRRLHCAKLAKLKTIPVQVFEKVDDDTALAWAVAENSSDSRHALSPLEQAAAFSALADLDEKGKPRVSFNQVGKMTGYSGQHVRTTITLLSTPKKIQEQLAAGKMSKMAALALAKADPEAQEALLDEIDEETTEREVQLRIKDYYADDDDDDDYDMPGTKKKSSAGGSSDMSIWRTKKEVRAQMKTLVMDIVEGEEEGGNFDDDRSALAGLFFCAGMLDNTNRLSEEFDKQFHAIEATIDWYDDEDDN